MLPRRSAISFIAGKMMTGSKQTGGAGTSAPALRRGASPQPIPVPSGLFPFQKVFMLSSTPDAPAKSAAHALPAKPPVHCYATSGAFIREVAPLPGPRRGERR